MRHNVAFLPPACLPVTSLLPNTTAIESFLCDLTVFTSLPNSIMWDFWLLLLNGPRHGPLSQEAPFQAPQQGIFISSEFLKMGPEIKKKLNLQKNKV